MYKRQHQDRPGRISLALDLMEELRAIMVDRFVITLINEKILTSAHFIKKENNAVLLNEEGRRIFLATWQNKKNEQITHPSVSYTHLDVYKRQVVHPAYNNI